MAGCRSLKPDEITRFLNALKTPRDKCLVTLGLRSGFRISELLSLTVPQVVQFGRVVERVRVQARHMKGKESTREIPVHPDAANAIRELLKTYPADYTGFLFKSQKSNKAISRMQAHRVLKQAINTCELQGKLATHTMRKTFAQTIFKALDHDIYKLAKALGHSGIGNTIKYLAVDQDEIDAAILKT
jgi:integrase